MKLLVRVLEVIVLGLDHWPSDLDDLENPLVQSINSLAAFGRRSQSSPLPY